MVSVEMLNNVDGIEPYKLLFARFKTVSCDKFDTRGDKYPLKKLDARFSLYKLDS